MTESSEERRAREQQRRVVSSPDRVPDSSPDKQRELKLNAGIAIIAAVLCFFVTGIFVWLHTVPLAIAFGVIGLACVAIFLRARMRRRRSVS